MKWIRISFEWNNRIFCVWVCVSIARKCARETHKRSLSCNTRARTIFFVSRMFKRINIIHNTQKDRTKYLRLILFISSKLFKNTQLFNYILLYYKQSLSYVLTRYFHHPMSCLSTCLNRVENFVCVYFY